MSKIGPPGPQPDPKQFTGGVLGTIQLFTTNSGGTSTFQLLFLVKPTGAVNISSRTTVGRGDKVLIAGLIIQGDATEAVIIRAIAPSLKTLINGLLRDPASELRNEKTGETVINDNWKSKQEALIIDSGLAPKDDLESAIIVALDPGNYTAVVRGKDDATGIAVVEVYDLGSAPLNKEPVRNWLKLRLVASLPRVTMS